MDARVQVISDKLLEMIQPCLGKREYGNLRIMGKGNLPNWVEDDNIKWFLIYEMILGSTSGISATFLPNEGNFRYSRHPDDIEVRTANPEEVLNHFRQKLDHIRPQRREHLMSNVKLKKGRDVPLEEAIAVMIEFAQKAQEFGPTKEELKLYEQFCHEVYSTG